MKLIITEDQLKRVIIENEIGEGRRTMTPEEIEKRNAKIIKIGKKYPDQNTFMKKNRNVFAMAKTHKLLDIIFPNRKKYRRDFEWTPEAVANIASEYPNKTLFFWGDQIAYQKAKDLGILDNLFPERKLEYTLDNSLMLADEFDNVWEFRKKYPAAFLKLKDNDLLKRKFPNYRPGVKGPEKGYKHKNKTFDEWIQYAKDLVNTQRLPLSAINFSLYNWLLDNGADMKEFKKPAANEKELILRAQKYGDYKTLRGGNLQLYKALESIPGALEKVFPGTSSSTPIDILSKKKLPNPNSEIPNDKFLKMKKDTSDLDKDRKYGNKFMFTPVTESK